MTSTPRHLTAVVLAMLGLLFVTTVLLASVHSRIRGPRLQAPLARGDVLARQKALAAAVEEYRAALSLAPDDPQARRSLALTLLSVERLAEAETYIRDLLRDAPTDGALNRGRIPGASSACCLSRVRSARTESAGSIRRDVRLGIRPSTLEKQRKPKKPQLPAEADS